MSATLTGAANKLNEIDRRPLKTSAAATFVLPELRIAYVTNLKAACSTVKWLLADLSGQDPQCFYASTGPRPTRAQTIHDRALWRGVDKLADHDLTELSAENGWFVFTVVRDPRARLWSAWQSKLLVGNPRFLRLAEEPWYPRVPRSAADVIEDFQRFVETLATGRRRFGRVGKDGHFRPQSDLIHRHGLRYTHVYDIAEIPTLERDLEAHLVSVGHDDLPVLQRENDTPLPLTKDVLAGGVDELIDQIYREDLKRFGSAWREGPSLHDTTWTDAAFADIAFRRSAHQRILDLSDRARRLEEDLARRKNAKRSSRSW